MHLTLFGNCTFIQSVIRHKLSAHKFTVGPESEY
jgi:hypothetical protein